MKLKDKVAVVTGAGSGIGCAIALRLALDGAKVCILELDQEKGERTAQSIRDAGGQTLMLRTDVTQQVKVREAINGVLKEFGKMDILVNNAGWDEIRLFVDTTEELWDKLLALNYKGVLNCCRIVLNHMIERKYGRIISIASDAGKVGSLGESVYAGTKGAVMAFSKSLAREVARYNITVNTVCPGLTDTPLVSNMKAKSELAQKILTAIEKATPMGRMGRPDDVANAVAFLSSDEAAFITGQTISVSGGLTMC